MFLIARSARTEYLCLWMHNAERLRVSVTPVSSLGRAGVSVGGRRGCTATMATEVGTLP